MQYIRPGLNILMQYHLGSLKWTAPLFQVEIHERGSATGLTKYKDLLVNFTPETVLPFTFPVYVSPDSKEDIVCSCLYNFLLRS